MKLVIALLFTLTLSLQAQIYADFTVSQGGSEIGTFRARLDYEKAPRTCANFIGLATGTKAFRNLTTGQVEKRPYFDGIIFHRLIHSFVIQGGDPLGTGTGGPGYMFQDEFDPELRHSGRYILSMANSGLNTNGSQFFITLAATPNLDDVHNVFGEVVNIAPYTTGRSIIDDFANSSIHPTNSSDRPNSEIRMDSVTITRVGAAAEAFDIEDESLRLPNVQAQDLTIVADGNSAPTLTFDQSSNTTFHLGLSPNLENWQTTSRFIASGEDSELDFEIPTSNQSTFDKHFYYPSRVEWPSPSFSRIDLQGQTLNFTANAQRTVAGADGILGTADDFLEGGLFSATFAFNGTQGVCSPNAGIITTGSQSGSFTIYTASVTPFTNQVITRKSSFAPPFILNLGYDSINSGRLTGTILSASDSQSNTSLLRGAFTLSPN